MTIKNWICSQPLENIQDLIAFILISLLPSSIHPTLTLSMLYFPHWLFYNITLSCVFLSYNDLNLLFFGRTRKDLDIKIISSLARQSCWLLCLRERVSEKCVFLKSVSDTEMKQKTSERKGFLPTPSWIGETSLLCATEDWYSSAGPFPQPWIDLYEPSLPTLSASLAGIRPVPSHRAPCSKGHGFVLYCQVVNFLLTFNQEPPIFICTSRVVQIHKLCDECYLHQTVSTSGERNLSYFSWPITTHAF